MQKRHLDRKQYFNEQCFTTQKYVIPFIEEVIPITQKTKVLEVGCGEGGNLVPFLQRGCEVVGVDMNTKQLDNARIFIQEALPDSMVMLLNKNIYHVEASSVGRFDLILLRDVIEHIHNQNEFMKYVKPLLKENGRIFFGFPPWCMPFGGHQQVCKSKLLSVLPFFHLLPEKIYRFILRLFSEREGTINFLLEMKETGISTKRFENIVINNGYQFDKQILYFVNPNYEVKFRQAPRELFKVIGSIPYLRDFFTTCCYALVQLKATPPNSMQHNSK